MRTPSIMILLASSMLALSAAACGDDPSIVATWREVPNAFDDEPLPVEQRTKLVFGDDGNVTVTEEGETKTSPYQLDGDRLTLTIVEPDETLTVKTDIVLTDSRLLVGAMFAQGDSNGPVGTWRGSSQVNERELETTFQLNADQTARFTQQLIGGGDQDVLDVGTWERNGESLRLTFQESEDVTVTFRAAFLDGEAIGTSMFERL